MNTTNIDLGRAVTYPFDDQDWVAKLGILLVLGLVPLVNLVMVPGYLITTADNIRQRRTPSLPDWAAFNGIAYRGLMVLGATLLYHLPVILLGCCTGIAAAMGPSGRSGVALVLGLQCCVGFLALLYAIAANALLNVGHVRFLQTGTFDSYTDFAGRVRDLRAEPNLFGTLILYEVVATVVFALLSAILGITCVGPLLLIPLYTTVSAFILGSTAAAAPAPAVRV